MKITQPHRLDMVKESGMAAALLAHPHVLDAAPIGFTINRRVRFRLRRGRHQQSGSKPHDAWADHAGSHDAWADDAGSDHAAGCRPDQPTNEPAAQRSARRRRYRHGADHRSRHGPHHVK